MWCHLPTGFRVIRTLRFVSLGFLLVVLLITLLFPVVSHAAPGTTKTLNFQGRLQTAAGALVADGHYNIQFKIYQDGAGTAANNPGGTLKWTETYINNGGTTGVDIKNGLFSVNLGSVNPFGTSIDWTQDTLFLSMNVAGSATACTTYGTSPCAADGEMLPMKKLTAVPFAINAENANMVGGKTADNFIQIAQGVQTDATSNTASIFLNKTGTGNLIQLQNTAADVFTVTNAGDLMLGSSDNHAIFINTSAANTAGRQLAVSGGSGGSGSGSAGGTLSLQGGNAGGTNGNGGNIQIDAGTKTGTGGDGFISIGATNAGTINIGSNSVALTQNINIGTNNTAGSTSNVTIGSGGSATGGTTTIQAKDGINIGNSSGSAPVTIKGGTTINTPTDSTNAFSVTTSLDYKVLTVDTANGRVAVGGDMGSSTPSLDGFGLQVQGGLRLSGGSAAGMTDVFTTPMGSSVHTKINIPLYNPGAYGQILAMGLPSTADPTARVLSLLDARTGAHQPTLTVFSPDENQVLGFSWDGSNTNAKVKTSSDSLTLQAGGQDLVTATKNGSDGILSVGNGATNSAPANFTIQATTSTTASVSGGALTVQGGGATTGNTNGGNLTLSGGTASGSGANGLVVLTTPTIQQVSDTCVGATADCTIAASSLNNNGSIIVGFSSGVSGKTATLPDPAITTAGRLIYITAASGSSDFTLAFNGGGTGNQITMRQNTAASLIWNGTDWIAVGAANSANLQDAYNNTPQSAGGAEIVLGNGANSGGLTVRDNATSPITNNLLSVQSSSAANLFSVSSSADELATNPGAETAGSSSGTFPANTWTSHGGGATVNRYTTAGNNIASGNASVETNTTYTWDGAMNRLTTTLTPATTYNVSLAVRTGSGTVSDFLIYYSKDGTNGDVWCSDNIAASSSAWTRVNCTFDTPASGITSGNSIFLGIGSNGSHTLYIDNLSVTSRANAAPNVQVGGGATGGPTTLFTVDKAASAPVTADHDALLGSMYYDTTIGKLQCYEAAGWGSCGASPDNFVTISPEYTNAVTNGTGIGTMTSDLCSDSLHINDGTSSQPTVCGTHETYNFYNWTSAEATDQTKSIYVTYQLSTSFKAFVAGSTNLMGRTDSANATITYQVYRNNSSTGLSACGSAVSVSTGSQSTWQKATATGGADPSSCGFVAGDSIVVRINFTAKSSANTYVSNLGFTYSNN